MSERARVLIVGGGIIGSAVAWSLAERGVDGVMVVDLDLAGLYASSELNAGGARATWWQPVNIEGCLATLSFFRDHAERFGFRPSGYLWLYGNPELFERALAKRELQNAYGLEVEALAPDEIFERFPLIDRNREEVLGATFSPGDGLLNPNAVRAFFREEAERKGVRFRNRDYVTGVVTARSVGASGSLRGVTAVEVVEVATGPRAERENRLREILTTHRVPGAAVEAETRIECETVVNCLGAWSPIFSAKIGIRDVTEPVRRQISLVDVHDEDAPPGVDLRGLGMLVDTSGLYLHGEGGHVLAGYSTPDEAPGFDFGYDGQSFFESEIWPRLAHRASAFERCGHLRGWAGLYAVTPDRSGIAGRVGGFSNLFEAHSFTGRGVMQSYAVGRAMAELIDTGRFETVDLAPLTRERFDDLDTGRFETVDLAPLTRERFDDPERWVMEELHI
ncbi:MAG: FAD-binding oxidoreductase [Deltaproteobacteria bacterium]|nr:FAD-binding oxidoreductase [Deltaproteobacteria bacterium]